MSAVVGGRMEVVAPQRSLFGPDYGRLAVLLAVSAAVHLWLLSHTAVTARDSLGFARYALNLQSPHAVPLSDAHPQGEDFSRNQLDVIRGKEHPPGYPAIVWLTAKGVRKVSAAPLPETTLVATQVASSVAAFLLVVPTYLLGRMLFGRSVGFAAALLFQVLPVPAQLTSDGLTEGVYLLAAATALVFGVRAVRRPGVGGFLLCGLAVGVTYLIRPEGVLVAAGVGLVAVVMGLRRAWPRDLAAGRLTALAVGFALVAVPYMLVIGGVTNKPTGKVILDGNPREAIFKGGPTGCAPVAGGPLFAAWWSAAEDADTYRTWWAVTEVAKETGKAMFYGPAALAVIGVVVFRRRVVADPGVAVLAVLVGLNALLLTYMGSKVGYVSERHTLLMVLVGCVFAAAALEPLVAGLASLPVVGRFWVGGYAAAGLLVAVVAAALPATLKPLHYNREGHKHAGVWLKDKLEADPTACLIDPFCWAEWYAWRSLYFVPTDPANARVHYAVLENTKTNPHSRLPRLDLAKDVARGGTLVYHWPEDVKPEEAKVHVYRTVR